MRSVQILNCILPGHKEAIFDQFMIFNECLFQIFQVLIFANKLLRNLANLINYTHKNNLVWKNILYPCL